MVFTSSQAETQGPLEESCCGEAGRLRRQQHSTRMEADTQHTELRIMQRCGLAFIWNAAVPLLPYSLGALLPLLGWHSKHADCLLHGWLDFRGDNPPWTSCQRMWPKGPWGGCCTHSRHVPPGPGGAHGSPQVPASCKQGHLQQLLLSEHRWRHSKSRRLFLAGHLWLQLPVPAEMSHSPLLPAPGTGAAPEENQQQPSLPAPRGFVPAPGEDKLQQHNSTPPSSREDQKPWGSVSWIRGAVIFL